MLRLLKLSLTTVVRGYKDALEKEEKIVQVTHTIKQSESNNLVMNDVRFRRKEEFQSLSFNSAAAAAAAAAANNNPVKHDSTSGTANTSPVQKKRVASTLP